MRHLDEGTIHAWLDGALNEEKARQAEEHAARCTQCAVAVADARGFIAGASRILLALDDVPGGVVPKGAGSALGARRSATATARDSATTSNRAFQPWMLKVAASIVVVATVGVLVVRPGARVPEKARVAEAKTDSFAPANGAPAAPAAAAGGAASTLDMAVREQQAPTVANAPAPVANARAEGLLKAKMGDSTQTLGLAAKPAGEPAVQPAALAAAPPAPAARQLAVAPAESTRIDSASAAPATNQLATVPPKIAVFQSGTAAREPSGAAKRTIGGQDAALPPGMHIVSEQTVTAQARVVQKRVYEVSPGVQVTYSIFEPAPAREKKAESDAPTNDSVRDAKDEAPDSDAGVNTIKWSDSTGTDFVLSGRLPLDSLRVIRSKLTTGFKK